MTTTKQPPATPADPSKRRPHRATKRGRGRPTKFSPDVAARIVGAVQIGAPLEVAAIAAGIDRSTLYLWMKAGGKQRARRRPHLDSDGRPVLSTLRDFFDAVNKAAGSTEVRCLKYIDDAAKGGAWQAAAWRLERMKPQDYARPAQRVIHEGGTVNTNLTVDAGAVDLAALDDEDLDALDRLTAKAIDAAKQPRSDAPGSAAPARPR